MFGFRPDVQGGASFLDDKTVAYAAGHNVVMHHLETKQQKVISAPGKCDTMTAMAVSSCKRCVKLLPKQARSRGRAAGPLAPRRSSLNPPRTAPFSPSISPSAPHCGAHTDAGMPPSTFPSHSFVAIAVRGERVVDSAAGSAAGGAASAGAGAGAGAGSGSGSGPGSGGSEGLADRAVVRVFDQRTLKPRKRLASADVESTGFVSVAFSSDSKLLLALGGAPDWRLVCWAWEKGKAVAVAQMSTEAKLPLYQCSFNPVDLSMCAVSGQGVLRFLRIVDGEFKTMPVIMGARASGDYLCHAWMADAPESVVVGTAGGELLLFSSGELVGALPGAPLEGVPVRSLAAHAKGFVCGCGGGRDRKSVV